MDIRKLLGISPKRKPGVASAGGYSAAVDSTDDPEINRTLGITVAAPASVRPAAAAHDSTLDALAKKAGRYRQPYRTKR